MDERPVGGDAGGILGLVILGLAALLYFGVPQVWAGLPPAYVRVGPVEFGQNLGTTCHGVRVDGEMVVEACK